MTVDAGAGATPWDGGSTWALAGSEPPSMDHVVTFIQSPDGRVQDARRFVAVYFDQPGVSTCTSPNTPFEVIEVRVELEDGGVITPGSYELTGRSFVTHTRYTSTGMALERGGLGTNGSINITRLDGRSSAGTFGAFLRSWADGGVTLLAGSWDTGLVECR